MSITKQFIAELTQEAATTRRVLERIPNDRLGWKPHPKSDSLGALAHHIAVLPRGITDLLSNLTTEPPTVPRPETKSAEEVVSVLEASVAYATDKLSEWGDEGIGMTWRMVSGGQTLIESSRSAMFRSLMLNHWYHHRGQLTVYLRMLDVALPPVFGPTADTV